MAIVPDNEDDAQFFARLDAQYAAEKARLEATYPAYEPTTADLAEYAAWSRSMQEHDDALQVWMDFFPDDERSTFFVD